MSLPQEGEGGHPPALEQLEALIQGVPREVFVRALARALARVSTNRENPDPRSGTPRTAADVEAAIEAIRSLPPAALELISAAILEEAAESALGENDS